MIKIQYVAHNICIDLGLLMRVVDNVFFSTLVYRHVLKWGCLATSYLQARMHIIMFNELFVYFATIQLFHMYVSNGYLDQLW